MSRPCRYEFQPGGCKRGSSCTFSHIAPGTGTSTGHPTRAHFPTHNLTSLPVGVCKFFWSRGRCDKDNCRFRHVRGDQPTAQLSPPPNSSVQVQVLPFLTDGGLAKVTGIGTDSLSYQPTDPLLPGQTQHKLKRFLADSFHFSNTFDIYAFLHPIDSAISTNPSWTHEDGQLFLISLTKENGLLRISQVLRWTPVSTLAGPDARILSFQQAWLPLLRFLSSNIVVKSTLHQHVNALYSIIMNDFETFSTTLITSLDEMVTRQSFVDHLIPSTRNLLGSQILASISGVLFQCLTRFKNAIPTHPQIAVTVNKLQVWLNAWVLGITSGPPSFDSAVFADNANARNHIINHLSTSVKTVVDIAKREQARLERARNSDVPVQSTSGPRNYRQEGLAAMLHVAFDGPGALRSSGPRHDNDDAEIQNIRIAPTHDELICKAEPFLPANFYDAPHHLPQESMERLLDIQFRLLREELTAPLRTSINLVRNDILSKSPGTKLARILEKKGGKYRGSGEGDDGVMFNVYAGVKFHSMTPDYRGISVNISFNTPPGRARQSSGNARAVFWESMGGKRMMQGGLIALIWSQNNARDVDVHLGTVASSSREIADSAKQREDRVSSRIIIFDPEVEVRILNVLKHSFTPEDEILLVEAPVMYEGIRPFLEGLTTVPETIPFKEYLVHRPQGYFNSHDIKPPQYTNPPRFKYQLEGLFDAGARDAGFELSMVASDQNSVEIARSELKRGSRLDPSQVDAVISALTKEVALIQGPPGTGKSYTGIELLRVLVGHVRPILLIAFTNHALDHLLSGVLDAGITKKIVRLGSRSTDERISQFSIENLEMGADKTQLGRSFGGNYRQLKLAQEQLILLVKSFAEMDILSSDIMAYIQIHYPEHHEHVCNPPSWINKLMSFWSEHGGWQTAGKRGTTNPSDFTTYGRWLRGEDLDFLKTRPNHPVATPAVEETSNFSSGILNRFNALSIDATLGDTAFEEPDSGSNDGESNKLHESDSDSESEAGWQRLDFTRMEVERPTSRESHSSEIEYVTPVEFRTPDEVGLQLTDLQNPLAFFNAHGMKSIPEIPVTDRPLAVLLSQGSVWALSMKERRKLDQYWREQTREDMVQEKLEEFNNIRRNYNEHLELFNQGKDETRRDLLRNIHIIGCTTTGAAKYASLLKGIEPKVLLVEEAGQVMEAHILANLVPSIEHLIMIGDPLQLRPTLNNYKLSVDSRRGNLLYRFDMSLMERLSISGFPMSRIDIQRRMRPEIAQLIRRPLYPGLEDHELVKHYPDVRGFARNVFFLTHENRENDGNEDDSGSKFNTYEVQMVKDLVLYLLRQGCYSQDGDIVVLCAYLGQLARIRDALSQHVAIVLDERDKEELADREAEIEMEESRVEHIQVSKRVRLRTVDNYQGEEAKVVILSLVRNAGGDEDDARSFGRTIGFLKSKNRTNVALSRAKLGLFILGNAAQLASKSEMWGIILEELQRNGSIGQAFPVACQRHQDEINYVSRPGQLSRFAPDGGCLQSCEYRLKCGHVCPYKCHPDDPHHVAVICPQSCRRLCARGHPCSKRCSEDCGRCIYPISHVTLPCGHIADSFPCYMMDDLDSYECDVVVTKQLTSCEHAAELPCSMDVSEHRCSRPCGGIMSCCGRNCGSSCSDCQAENQRNGTSRIERKSHRKHQCKKPLYCGHECSLPCSQDHECTIMCRGACRQRCVHSRCSAYCSTPCEPCKELCTWECSHHKCPLPCGSVCARLPCDKKCKKSLQCGHRCPSVCGEDCSVQICPACASPELKETVVDLILCLKLDDVLMDEDSLDNLLITLPECRHVFTVETLDGVCGLEDYYTKDDHGQWRNLASPQYAGERKKPPVCPTCRSAITSPRYGRVFKSANLDILERNVISHMSNRMRKVQGSWSKIMKSEMKDAITEQAKLVKLGPATGDGRLRKRTRKAILNLKELRPVPTETIIPNDKFFNISQPATQVWNRIVRDLTKIYKDAADICDIRSAHANAWEAAFSFLYEQEMDKTFSDPEHAPRRPREYAMRSARMQVGIPQPLADKRFLVEAIWATLQVRFTLVELAQAWIQGVRGLEDSVSSLLERQEWGNYGAYILESCEKDVDIAYGIAKSSDSRRQMTKTVLLSLRVQLEKCRFNIEMYKQCDLWDKEQRLKSAQDAENGGCDADRVIVKTKKEHMDALPADIPGWFAGNFLELAKAIREEWKNMERMLKTDTFYEPVSLDEKMAIVKAFDFSHTGHFYTCQNGHAFVITECGGAMQASRCPECGQPIGGQSHTLDSSNRRAEEFEELARQAGSERNPWPWAQ